MYPRSFSSKVKSSQSLRRLLLKTKKQVVFTNGCFDLMHRGHVTYLEKARNLGEFLLVALNSDASVKRLKGRDRPLNSLADRMDVIAALESVDFVTWFEEDTPLNLIRLLKPNILVKGGDWKVEQIVGAEDVFSWGGKVKSLRYVEGKSTTQIIAQARR